MLRASCSLSFFGRIAPALFWGGILPRQVLPQCEKGSTHAGEDKNRRLAPRRPDPYFVCILPVVAHQIGLALVIILLLFRIIPAFIATTRWQDRLAVWLFILYTAWVTSRQR